MHPRRSPAPPGFFVPAVRDEPEVVLAILRPPGVTMTNYTIIR